MHYGKVAALAATLTLTPAIWLGAWGSKLPLWAQTTASAIALVGAAAIVPLARSLEEDIKNDRAGQTRRYALLSAQYAASTERGISQIRQAYGIGHDPGYQHLLNDMAAMADLISQIGMVGQQPAIDVPALAPDLPRYDLASLPGESRHLLICGDTGSGKSTLVKFVVSLFPRARVRVYDCDATAHDWAGYEVIGSGDEFGDIEAAMLGDLDEFGDRAGLNTNEVRDLLIAEEYPAIAAEIDSDVPKDWLKALARRGRKRGFRIVMVTQDIQVDSLGLRNQSKLLSNFNKLFLGAYAFDKLQEIKDRQLRANIHAHLQQQDRPCLAEVNGRYFPCDLPVFSGAVGGAVAPVLHQRLHQLEARQHQGSPVAPVQGAPLVNTDDDAISPTERGRIIELHRMGYSQNKIIEAVWGVPKSGTSAKYQICRAKYRQVLDEIGG